MLPSPTPRTGRLWTLATLLACAFLLLVNLGHYPLWDDEACTAILRGVWATGDSLAVQGNNVMAYGGGNMLFGLHDRVHPPLQLYLMAPFVGLLGSTSFAARLPFALTGLATIALLLHWLRTSSPTKRQIIIFTTLILTNVPLFLYLRQGRYYALAMLVLTLAAYLYLRLPARPRLTAVLALGLTLALLPLTSAQVFATFAPAFLLDYLLFGRKRTHFSLAAWLTLLTPSALACLFILLTWNPLVIASDFPYSSAWWHRPTMIWWAIRDLNDAHLGVGALLLLAPAVAKLAGKPDLYRATVAVVALCVLDGLVDPQSPLTTGLAEIRHLAPIIPLTMAIALGVIDALWNYNRLLGPVVLALATLTNVLHWGALQPGTRLRSLPYLWASELIRPEPDPYSAGLALINDLPPATTLGVEPAYMRYPLMYHRPDLTYTWQLRPDQRSRLHYLPDAQFVGASPPAYFLGFGRFDDSEVDHASDVAGRKYTLIAKRPDVYWRDTYRPEITKRVFGPALPFNPFREGIYLFKLPDAPTNQN